MPPLSYEVMKDEVRTRFPAHGWALNPNGLNLLRFPICGPLWVRFDPESLVFVQTLRRLVQTLGELHRITRVCSDMPNLGSDPDRRSVLLKELGNAPLFIDLAYVYLRRLADRLARALRPLLFPDIKFGSAPMKFSALRELLSNVETANRRLDSGKVDAAMLCSAFFAHSNWYTVLTANPDEEKGIDKGIRDAMEHWSVALQIGQSGCEPDFKMQTSAHLVMRSQGRLLNQNQDLIVELRNGCADLCGLLTGICQSIRLTGNYDRMDYGPTATTGLDEDIVGFWPAI